MPRTPQQRIGTRWNGRIAIDMAARVMVLVLLWLPITEFETAALPFGAVAVTLGTVAGWYVRPPNGNLVSPVGAVRFLGTLIGGIARTSADVARRAILPRDRMAAPAFITYRLREPSRSVALGLSYTLTLMPGTAGAVIKADELDVHVLDQRTGGKELDAMEASVGRAVGAQSPDRT
ncbi:Na+/H+ antiporter subunit E [Caenispirillum salinarum]|uniref:Na+/H+ antiporter subunit E n=1 Tax=Caenispirillum salinarum TaxID=859058 RepID=UPI00384FA980